MEAVLVQWDIAWEDKPANYTQVAQLLKATPAAPGSLIVLPEMFATGFSMNTAATVEVPNGTTEVFLQELAQTYQSAVIAGVAVRDNSGMVRNQALAISPEGTLLARTTKQRSFSVADEGKFYTQGNAAELFDYAGFRCALFLCYDLRFPELFRAAVAQGATLFLVLANWPLARQHHWLTLLQARAIENQACVIGVNRTGRDPQASYGGRSVMIDPRGEIVADAGDGARVLVAALEPSWVHHWRAEFPALRDAQLR